MNQDKDEITDLGEALVAIIQSPPGTWVDDNGWLWRWHDEELQYRCEKASWRDVEIPSLRDALPIRRVRYGWVPCEYEEAHQLPDGLRAYLREGWAAPAFADTGTKELIDDGSHWVKWGRL